MKAGWEVKSLGDLCKFVRGPFGGSLKKDIFVQEGYAVYEQQHAIYNQFNQIRYFIDQNKFNEMSRFTLNSGDLIMSCSGTMGKVAIVPENIKTGIINQALLKLTPSKLLLPKFLKYWMDSESFQDGLREQSGGAAIQNVASVAILKEIKIAHPVLSEQQRIVAILDQAFEGIAKARANAEQNLQNARALFESHLQSVFTQRCEGWDKKKLDLLTTKIGSGATPRGGEESYKAEGISLVRSMNVHDFGFKYAKLAFLDDSQAKELSNVELKSNDVLLNITGASVARCCIVPDNVLPARVNQHVSIIRPVAEKLDSSFLHYLLLSKPYKDKLLQTGSEGGSTRQAITKAQIQEFVIEFPPAIEDQKVIVHKLNEILKETQHLEAIYQRKIACLDELKKSLLQQAFAGEL
ncbi:MAG: restriction endonuclease subunit S [Methylophilus sp.]